AATQAFVRPLKSFSSVEELVRYREDDRYRSELRSLFAHVEALSAETSIYPDLLTAHNVVLVRRESGQESLAVIDTLPKTPLMRAGSAGRGQRRNARIIDAVVAAVAPPAPGSTGPTVPTDEGPGAVAERG